MLRLASLSLTAAALTIAVLACGDDDDTATLTPTLATESATAADVVTPGPETTAPSDDFKTSPPAGGNGGVTPVPNPPGDTPTAPPTATAGIPAVAPDDQGAFVGQFQGLPIDDETCQYNPANGLVTCPDADYRIDPPMVGQDIACSVWIVNDAPEVVQCTSQEPLATTYYEIME